MNRIQRILYKLIKKEHLKLLEKQYQQHWRSKLEDKHLQNCRILSNRLELLNLMPKAGIVAELGVDNGYFSEIIMGVNKPSKIYLVDPWDTSRYNDSKYQKVFKKFEHYIKSEEVLLVRGLSTEVSTRFEDDYFDWIYIDTDHSFQTTFMELVQYAPKMKKEGIICGHDFVLGNFAGLIRYGVIEAVTKFCLEFNWEFIYLTFDHDDNPSFAIRKM
jgi:predicted O-methyltransferase YrrM